MQLAFSLPNTDSSKARVTLSADVLQGTSTLNISQLVFEQSGSHSVTI
jgi:hypothetical protein